jgi:NADH-quinone oxidoreductase subunit C
MMNSVSGKEVLTILENSTNDGFGGQLEKLELSLGDPVAYVSKDGLFEFLKFCRDSSALNMNMLLHLTAVDWLDERDCRFDLVYHLTSINHTDSQTFSSGRGPRLRVKAQIPEEDLSVESVLSIWRSANFMEREVWDMFGITFKNHPYMKRVLLYEEFKGHPLRKDYPLTAKQPRIPLRSPEVQNSATLMVRPELVSIRTKGSLV